MRVLDGFEHDERLQKSKDSIFTFSWQAFNEHLDFATVHSLMKGVNLIDSCQAHLPVQYASNIKFIRPK